jgi:NADPH:quinone reductase-like Zn-dependent oxidoreductase
VSGRAGSKAKEVTIPALLGSRRDRYGSPDVVRLQDVDKPELVDDGVLVRVQAASINRYDWYALNGTPWPARFVFGLRRPKVPIVGSDFAGIVEEVGAAVEGLQPGDEVFGARNGSAAEYVCARACVGPKPANLTFAEAAAVPLAGLTALQGLRDAGRIQPGHRVLVNGASGGVGTFALQLAKALGGADVTAVCSTRNVEQAWSLGADGVIDYTREDFTSGGGRYDVLFDNAGNRKWREYARVLAPEGVLVLAGVASIRGALQLVRHFAAIRISALRGPGSIGSFTTKPNSADLGVLRQLIEAGAVRPVVERTYRLDEAADALRYMGTGHVGGKLVVTVT